MVLYMYYRKCGFIDYIHILNTTHLYFVNIMTGPFGKEEQCGD